MSHYTDDLEYSLAKRIPDMERGFVIETNYGRINISTDQAAPIIKAVKIAVGKDLAYALRAKETA